MGLANVRSDVVIPAEERQRARYDAGSEKEEDDNPAAAEPVVVGGDNTCQGADGREETEGFRIPLFRAFKLTSKLLATNVEQGLDKPLVLRAQRGWRRLGLSRHRLIVADRLGLAKLYTKRSLLYAELGNRDWLSLRQQRPWDYS